jgi:hypothetical protein
MACAELIAFCGGVGSGYLSLFQVQGTSLCSCVSMVHYQLSYPQGLGKGPCTAAQEECVKASYPTLAPRGTYLLWQPMHIFGTNLALSFL